MRVSPQVLAILTASGLVGLLAPQAQANPAAEQSPGSSVPNLLQELGTGLGAEANLLTTPAASGLAPAGATTASEGASSLELDLPRARLNAYSQAVKADLQTVINQFRPEPGLEAAAANPTADDLPGTPLPLPTPGLSEAHLSQTPSDPSPTQPSDSRPPTTGGGSNVREITPEEAQEIIDRAVERRSQPQGAPTEPTPPPAPTETEPAAEPPATTAEPEPEPRVLVAEVQVVAPEGELDAFLVDLVYGTIQTRAGRTTTRTQLQQDINNIFATGYFADVDAVPQDTDLGVQVTFVVQPNPVLTGVDIVGNEVLPDAVAEEIFADQVGQIINLLDFQDSILELNQWYQDNGYVLAQVIAAPRVSEQGVVTLEVAEGVIESIKIRFFNDQGESVDAEGNPLRGRTHDYIITREFTTQPGDVFNQAQIEQDFQRAFGLGIFEDLTPGLEPGVEDPREVVLVVNVTERSTGSLAAGVGFNFTGDFFGTVSYRQDNFGGNNQKFTAEAQLSTRDILFDVSFTDPWIAGDPYRTSYTANTFASAAFNLNFEGGPITVNLPDGDRVRIRRFGAGISFTRPYPSGWVLSIGTLLQNASSRNADGVVSPFDAEGNPITVSPTGIDDLWTFPFSATLDRRDSPLTPTRGSLMRFNIDQSLPVGRGSILFTRLRGTYSYFIPVSLITFNDGPQTLAFNFQLGTTLGEIPPYDAFALGGSNSIRGWDEGGVGSGRSYGQFSAEYRFPLFSFLGAVLFFDAGSALGSQFAVPGAPGPTRGKPDSGFGYGIGARVQTPLGPLRIDYGIGNQGTGFLYFGIGERF
ncbi:MAG TPA: BamA/TamA family outer membrane protein [Leptolyngbyaceae cyanobacterium M65_K2018_010]|nr:BamA/TamA family outer membrane protein [Leptolyngbyaceae cyanobacterium M65_K2018_010]